MDIQSPPKEIETDITKFEERNTLPQTTQDSTPDAIMLAIQKGYEPAFIEKMMDLADRNDRKAAQKAYVEAMAAFKADPPQIFKTKKAGFDHKDGHGRTEYSFAPLPVICSTIDPALAAQGLSYTWKHNQDEKNIIVTCIVTHRLGHSEESTLKAPRDDSGKKNLIQSMGSTISYLERYTLLGILGLATHDMDDDGNSTGEKAETINTDQVIEINDLIKESGANEKLFLQWCEVEKVEDIPLKHTERIDYQKAKAELQRKRDKPKK